MINLYQQTITQQELEDNDYSSLEIDNEIANPDVVTLEDDNYLSSENDSEIDTPAVAKPVDILKPTRVTFKKLMKYKIIL